MVDSPALLDAYYAFLLGNYNLASKLLHKIRPEDDQLRLKVDVLNYRVYIAQKKYGVVLDEVVENTDVIEFKLLRLLALFFSSSYERSAVIKEVEQLIVGSLNPEDETALILAATIYLNAEMPEMALKVLHQGEDIYCNALRVQCYIALHRYDLAGKTVRRMQTADEDALPCQLATALFNLTKDSSNADVLVNMIMVSQHLCKPVETINRLISQLKDANKDHLFLREYAAKEEEFLRCAQQYAPSVCG
ncbi:coatomer subunit epsilon [Paragonimus westermani]|uniref:Coatomer subunit epsilon n=1 Tax=Paragonimus westermani TaxID=34504 RepID=A0A5J4NEI1_9TREM|nr:coatomer subunit epsilon [Paragonimus westermani]